MHCLSVTYLFLEDNAEPAAMLFEEEEELEAGAVSLGPSEGT